MGHSSIDELFKLDLGFHLVVQDWLGDIYELDYDVLVLVMNEVAPLDLNEPECVSFGGVVGVILPKLLLWAVNLMLVEDNEYLVLEHLWILHL